MIRVKDVSKQFSNSQGSLDVLDNVSFDIKEGEFAAIVGPSGCGKTTVLKLVAGLLEPTSGQIERKEKGKLKVGFVFQKPNLLEWRTVEENIKLPLELQHAKGDSARKFLKMVELSKFGSFFPSQLSGGMQQRVAIARALSHGPDILLLDEPFSAIDDLGREELHLTLARIWQKTQKTILFVTHNIEEAVFLADKVIVLSNRPAKVKGVLPVSLERPRKPEIKHTPTFQGHIKWVKSVLSS